jgi:hypothetical protein
MLRERWWTDSPPILTLTGKELDVPKSLKIEAEPLVQGKPFICSGVLGVRFRVVVCGVQLLYGLAELPPRTLASGRKPQEKFVRPHRILRQSCLLTAR